MILLFSGFSSRTMDNRKIFKFSILPITIPSNLLGIFPISIKITDTGSVKVSKFKVFYGFCISSFLSGFAFYRLLITKSRGAESLIYKFTTIAYPIITFTAFWFFLCRAKSMSKLLEDVFSYLKFLRGNKKSYSFIFWILLGQMLYLLIVMALYYVRLYIVWPIMYSKPFLILDRVCEMGIFFAIPLLSLQQANLLFFIHKVFAFLNQELKSLDPGKIFTPRSKFDLMKGKYQKIHAGSNHDLEFIADLYEKICKTCEILNFVFGAPASASAAHTLIQTVITLYYFLLNKSDVYVAILRITTVNLELWILLFACEHVVNEVRGFFFELRKEVQGVVEGEK